jgi:hypothetical protein
MNSSNKKLHATLALIILAIGAVLMAGKIYADSEPGLVPIVLVLIGIVWFGVARVRNR